MINANVPGELEGQYMDLRSIIRVLKKRRMLIAVVTLLAVIAGAVYSYVILQPSYRARTLLLVTQATDAVGKSQITVQDNDLNAILGSAYRTPVLTMNTYLGEIKSEALMRRVIEKLGLYEMGYTPGSLAKQISATVPKDSYLIEVTVTAGDPALAVSIANTLNKEFMAMMTEKNQELIDHSVRFLQDQMTAIRLELAATSDPAEKDRLYSVYTRLSEGITQTQIARNVDLGSTSLVVFSPAMSPYIATPSRVQIIGVVLLLGLMVSVGLALLLEYTGDNYREKENIEPQYIGLMD